MPHSRRLKAMVYTLIAAASLPVAAAAAEQCPEVVDRWPAGPADEVFIRTGRTYYGSGTVLTIGDVTTPASPTVLAEVNLGLLIHDIAVDNQVGYVAAGNMVAEPGTVFRLDLTDPAAPVVVAAWETPLPARSVAIGDGVVFAGLVDPTDPEHGVLLELVPGASPTLPPRITTIEFDGWPERLDVTGDTLWVAALGTGGLQLLDLSDPSSPDILDALDEVACGVSGTAADRDLAYVATAAPSGLLAVMLSPGGELFETGFQPLPGYPADAVLSGTRVYTVDLTAGVSAVDVAACRGPLRPAGRRTP